MARNKNSINADYRHGYRIEFYPTKEQAIFIDKCINAARYVYNWALEKEQEHYQRFLNKEETTQQINHKVLRSLFKNHRNETKWLKEVPNETLRNSLKRVTDSYELFFIHATKKPPKYKSKKKAKKSFTTRVDRFHFKDSGFRIEGLKRGEYINIKFDPKFDKDTKFHNVVIVKDTTNRYWLTFSTDDVEDKSIINLNINKSEPIGIDVNKHNRYALSNGMIFVEPDTKKLDNNIKRLERKHQKDIHRKQERTNLDADNVLSKRAEKRKLRLNKLYKHKHNIVYNQIYEVSNTICKMNPEAIVMEDLQIRSMIDRGRHYMNKQLHAIPFLQMQRTMQYKCRQYGIQFILADHNYPSSKLCSNCGCIKDNMKSQRIFCCPVCGYREDRDINAARNLMKLAL